MLKVQKCDLGGLKGFSIKRDPKAPTVVLLHGYGAQGDDLVSLADSLPPWNFYFPQAPLPVYMSPFMEGYSWFPITIESLQEGIEKKRYEGEGIANPSYLEEITHSFEKWMRTEGLDWERTFIGGFSQGSVLATEIAMRAPSLPMGLILLSSVPLSYPRLKQQMVTKKGLHFFQSHGIYDTLLPYDLGLELYDVLCKGGLEGEFCSFEGAHEIPKYVINELEEFMYGREQSS